MVTLRLIQRRQFMPALPNILLILLCLVFVFPAVAAAEAAGSVIKQIRSSQTDERVRIVFDVDSIPGYHVIMEESPPRLRVRMDGAVNQSGVVMLPFRDPLLSQLRLVSNEGGLEAIIDLKITCEQQVFVLHSQERLVVDLLRSSGAVLTKGSGETNRANSSEVLGKGLTYTLKNSSSADPLRVHILDIDPRGGYGIRPVLSNNMIAGIETLSVMTNRVQALAAVNASYFEPNGAIIGLLKLNGRIISTPYQRRAVLGCFPQGRYAIDRISYDGWIELPDGSKITIGGVNRERGADELILYNSDYAASTGTNIYGSEWVIRDEQVIARNGGNSPLTAATQILSAHGAVTKAMAGLQVGDRVVIHQSLGDEWDQALHVLGAGPLLVKNGEIFVSATEEEFGADVAAGRAPRTAVGITDNGHILLVVVDGRQSFSRGMTLRELAFLLRDLGAKDAMNLDGGGSSEMIVRGRIVNSPSDGRERRVGDGLIVLPLLSSIN